MNQILKKCPVCKKLMFITGQENKKKLTSCGHSFAFKKTKSQKLMDRKYVSTKWGLELK